MLYNTRYTAVLCIGFLLLSASLFARQDTIFTQVPVAKFDTWYIAGYTDLLTTRLFLLYENAALTINPLENKNNGIVYRPNVNIRVGIAGFWKWFGLGLSLDNPFYKTDRNTYGSTSVLDLRVNAFGRFLAAELFLQNFKSLYISSPKTRKGSYYIIPDMHVFSLGLSGFWIANEKRYSIRAAFIQNEQQKKSAGSFLVMPSFLYYRITSDHGIIPDGIISSYQIPATGLITRGEFYSVSLSPGYVYTLVFLKNFSITGAIFPGLAAHLNLHSRSTEGLPSDIIQTNGF